MIVESIFFASFRIILWGKGEGRKYYRIAPFAHIEGKKKNFGVGGKKYVWKGKRTAL